VLLERAKKLHPDKELPALGLVLVTGWFLRRRHSAVGGLVVRTVTRGVPSYRLFIIRPDLTSEELQDAVQSRYRISGTR